VAAVADRGCGQGLTIGKQGKVVRRMTKRTCAKMWALVVLKVGIMGLRSYYLGEKHVPVTGRICVTVTGDTIKTVIMGGTTARIGVIERLCVTYLTNPITGFVTISIRIVSSIAEKCHRRQTTCGIDLASYKHEIRAIVAFRTFLVPRIVAHSTIRKMAKFGIKNTPRKGNHGKN